MEWNEKRQRLLTYMKKCAETDVALAFSGGVDSSLLLKMACDCAAEQGTRVYAVTFQTRLHPPCDLEAAKKIAGELNAEHIVLQVDETGNGGDPEQPGESVLSLQKESVRPSEGVCRWQRRSLSDGRDERGRSPCVPAGAPGTGRVWR